MFNLDPKLTKEKILAALDAIDLLLQQKGVIGELCIFGGATMTPNLIPAKTAFFIEEIADLLQGGPR